MSLITQQDAAKILGVSKQVINNWIRRGKLRCVEKYGKRLIRQRDLDKLMD